MNLEENKRICRRLVEEAWTLGTLHTVDETVASDCRFHDPAFPSLPPGAESYKQHIHMCRVAFPDLSCSADDILAERDEVVIHWTVRGTHKGKFLGLDPTNRAVMVSGTSIHRLEDGKIVELWADWNSQALRDQLGFHQGESRSNKAVARRFVEEIWNQKKPDRIRYFVAEDYTRFSPTGTLQGPQGLRQDYDTYVTAFPDCHLQIEDMICEGDQVAVRFLATGTHSGRLGLVAPSGKHLSVPGAAMLRIENGKIVSEHVTWDTLSMMQQIGAAPAEAARVKSSRA